MTGNRGYRARSSRYMTAGYLPAEEGGKELYLNDDAYQSAAGNTRDPRSTMERMAGGAERARRRSRSEETEKTILERLLIAAGKDALAVVVCVALTMLLLCFTVMDMSQMVKSFAIQDKINATIAKTQQLEKDSEKKANAISSALDTDALDNYAANKLKMLRAGRGNTDTVYVKLPESTVENRAETAEKGFSILDFFLGVLSVLGIGE